VRGPPTLPCVAAALPERPPFVLRARILTPLAAGGTRWEGDGVLAVGADGRIAWLGSRVDWERRAAADPGAGQPVVDVRPWLLVPGLVDLHVHLPQVPAAGLGAGLDLLAWLERHVFPLERGFDRAAAERLAPAVFRAMAAAGTTTVVAYGAIWADSLDACFEAAEAHGIRAILGKVMMDRVTYDDRLPRDRVLERSLRESEALCARWHGAADGRLGYAVTPRFAVSCTAELLRESADLAARTGAWWQTHLSEERAEVARVAELFPDAIDYLDVYDRAGALRPRSILAHAIHLSDREVARLAESGAAVAHCPASNLFLTSGVMPLARYLEAGIPVGLGSDVAGAPDLSIVTQMRVGMYAQSALRSMGGDPRPPLRPLDWLRLATLGGARALGLDDRIGSLEADREADLVAIDPGLALPPGGEDTDDPEALVSRVMFRERPGLVRGAWVRGRRLEGPRGAERDAMRDPS
jgi:guanine deaminase